MAYDGSGTFNRLYNWQQDAANGINILAERMDNEMTGMANGMSIALLRDGQAPMEADLSAGGFRITNLTNPVVANDAVNKGFADVTYTKAGVGSVGLFGSAITLLDDFDTPKAAGFYRYSGSSLNAPNGGTGGAIPMWAGGSDLQNDYFAGWIAYEVSVTSKANPRVWFKSTDYVTGGDFGEWHRLTTLKEIEANYLPLVGTSANPMTGNLYIETNGKASTTASILQLGGYKDVNAEATLMFQTVGGNTAATAYIQRITGTDGSFQFVQTGAGAFRLSHAGTGDYEWVMGAAGSVRMILDSSAVLSVNPTGVAAGGIKVGTASGGVGLNVNDGGGNASVTFNNYSKIPDQDGSAARIAAAVDSLTATLDFEVADNVETGVETTMTLVCQMLTDSVIFNKPLSVGANTTATLLTVSNDTDASLVFRNADSTVLRGYMQYSFDDNLIRLQAYTAAGGSPREFTFGNTTQTLIASSVLRQTDGDSRYARTEAANTYTQLNSFNNSIALNAGSAANPPIRWSGNTNTGLYYSTYTQFSHNGVFAARIDPAGTDVTNNGTLMTLQKCNARYSPVAVLVALTDKLVALGSITPAEAITILEAT